MAYFYNSTVWLEHNSNETVPLKLGQKVIAPPLHPNSCLTPKGIVLNPKTISDTGLTSTSGGSDLRLWCYTRRARNVKKQNSYLRTLKSPHQPTTGVNFALVTEDEFDDGLPDLYRPRPNTACNAGYNRSRSTPANNPRFRLSNLDARSRVLHRLQPQLDVGVSRPPGLGPVSPRSEFASPCRVSRFSENAFKPPDQYVNPKCTGFRTKSAMEKALRNVVGPERAIPSRTDIPISPRPLSMTRGSTSDHQLQALTARSAGPRLGTGGNRAGYNSTKDTTLRPIMQTSKPFEVDSRSPLRVDFSMPTPSNSLAYNYE